jgi:DNA-directed RNA polymerase sigma subunit (sigma70/sigma32)
MEKTRKRKRDNVIVEKEEVRKLLDETDGDVTLQQVGDMYGITRMRVCQIEKSCLRKLSEIKSLKELL